MENVILFCLLTAAAVCYSALERRQLLKLGEKIKNLNLKFYRQESKKISSSTHLKNKTWYYRGEGNAYLSLSIPETRQILRIKKIPYPVGIIEHLLYFLFKNTSLGHSIEAKARVEEKLNLKYYHSFIALLGESYVQPAKEALLDRNEIWEIDNLIEPLRPKNRKTKHLAYACGSLLADYAYFPVSWDVDDFKATYSVEIKPKQGWIPDSERLYPMCTYCLNQYIKLQNGEVGQISKYCPMDIFSGSTDRMKYAVKCLLNSPQNNMKIFKDGQLLYGESCNNKKDILCDVFETSFDKSLSEFSDLITKALLTNVSKSDLCPNGRVQKHDMIKYTYNNNFFVKTCDFNQTSLPPGCVLERILKLQKLDKWGSEEILSKLKDNCHVTCDENPLISPCRSSCQNNLDSIVNQYLMAAVAKDLSLMITFKRILESNFNVPEQNIITTDNGSQYAFQIGVFDLYPKKITSIAKHANKRQMLAKIYEKLLTEQVS